MTQYIRTMEITFGANNNEFEQKGHDVKVQSMLHDRGIHMVSSYFSQEASDAQALPYNLQSREKEEETFHVIIDDKQAITTQYRFQSRDIVEQLTNAGFDARFEGVLSVRTSSTYLKWQGKYMMHTWGSEGRSCVPLYPSLLYHDNDEAPNINMKTSLYFSNDEWVLSYVIECNPKSITDRKKIEDYLVNVPAYDMSNIRAIVEEVLLTFTDSLDKNIECNTKINTHANYECKPESISLVMGDEEE